MNRRTVLICCGGRSLYTFQGERYGERPPRERCLSEAQMMAAWLIMAGLVPRADILLEDESMTTTENGARASRILESVQRDGGEVVLVSKADHLPWARELYVRYPRLCNARLEGAVVDKGRLMDQLRRHAQMGDAFAATRLGYLEDGVTGLD